MKNLYYVTIILILFNGCDATNQPSPSQNEILNKVSKSNAAKEKKGLMQESFDSWLASDWDKNTQGFEESKKEEHAPLKSEKNIAKKETQIKPKKEEGFLQHYVDKVIYYHEHEEEDNSTSHVEEMEKLPVIGE